MLAADSFWRAGQHLSAGGLTLKEMRNGWPVAALSEETVGSLARAARLPSLAARLLVLRGVEREEEAHSFLHPALDALHDPFLMYGVEEAAAILARAAAGKQRIVVFGDYDVDGVTAVAQLKAALLRAGADAISFLPHRIRDGYGLRPETVVKVLDQFHPAVIVTVDCGITAVEGVACARARGVEVIVTDHHLVPEELPSGAVVVNPKQPRCRYPEKELAASGIAFKLAQAVARRAGVGLSVESLLRVACLGTVADLVPLTGENRALVAAGLAALASPRAPGLRALLAECGVEPGRAPTSEEVAFRLAPRLNAAGRIDTAERALALFEERDPKKAAEIARALSIANAQRQSIERRVVGEARDRIAQSFDPDRDAVIVEAGQGWHRGVLGIAASRLAREYQRPVLLFALEGDRASGSGRSVPGVALHEALKGVSGLLQEFGGHDQAVGASLPAARWEEFRESARAHFAAVIPPERFLRTEQVDAELPIEDIDEELFSFLERLEPHGMGNPRPVFAAEVADLGSSRPLGDSGAAGRLRRAKVDVEWLCWRRELLDGLEPGAACAARYRLSRNRARRMEAEILDAHPSGREILVPGPVLPSGLAMEHAAS
jgi:single-stranded-DNA-specific exonuclease